MAIYSEGITATWGSVTFGQVQALSWNYGGGGARGRDEPWTDDLGTVSIQCLGDTGISTANNGNRELFTIAGGGCDLTCHAIYESVSVDAELNGVTRYTVSLKILDQ